MKDGSHFNMLNVWRWIYFFEQEYLVCVGSVRGIQNMH
jgi:hypothetical protein